MSEHKPRVWAGGKSSHGNTARITVNQDGSGTLHAREHRATAMVRLSADDIASLCALGGEQG